MNKSLILNFEVLKEQDITIEEFLKLYSIYSNKTIYLVQDMIDLEKLENKLFIKKIENKIYLREKSIKLIEFLSIEIEMSFNTNKKEIKKSKRVISLEVEERIHEFRDKWRGLKAGSMGSEKSCKEKLNRWMKENPKYSFEDILKASDLYLATEGANVKFLQRADYFIFKQDSYKNEMSRLSAFIDEININHVQDWTSNLN